MAISSTCCLSFSTPPAGSKPPSLPPSKTTANYVAWPSKSERWSLKEKSFQGLLTCAILFSDLGIFENHQISAIAAQEDHQVLHEMVVIAESRDKTGNTMGKWSEKRKCPSWQLNSLETIVPENLPRPHTRRRWEEVADLRRPRTTTAPEDVRVDDGTTTSRRIIRITSSCFSM